jgi:hypothetical protein
MREDFFALGKHRGWKIVSLYDEGSQTDAKPEMQRLTNCSGGIHRHSALQRPGDRFRA